MLHTNLKHIETDEEYKKALNETENAMISCGRMGPMCIPVYSAMLELEKDFPHVAFYDMDFDIPVSAIIRQLPECMGFMGLPFTIYYKNGEIVQATSSIQSKDQVEEILKTNFQ